MQGMIVGAANVLAILGAVLCLVAGLSRLMGMYYVAGFEALTLLNAGIAPMVLSLLLKLELIYSKVK